MIGTKTDGSTVERELRTVYGQVRTIEFDDTWSNLESLVVLHVFDHQSYYLGFDNFVVTRIPEPPMAPLTAVALSLMLFGKRAHSRRTRRNEGLEVSG